MSKITKTLITLATITLIALACQPAGLSTTPAKPTPVSLATEITPTATSTVTPTPLPSPTPTLALTSDFIKGAWFADWGLGPGVDTLDGKVALTNIILPLGANWIGIQEPCQMDAKNPAVIKCNSDGSLSDAAIATTTQTAHSLGLRVALLFVLEVDGVQDNWSANLDYGSDDKAWSLYFDAYATQLTHYAELAEQDKVDLLMIGGEQTGAQTQEKHWRSLISQVRAVYHGLITYEAWCQHFDSVGWWDAVDYIGINYYCQPLSYNTYNPTYDDIKKHNLEFLQMIKEGTSRWHKQVILTEVGYASIGGVSRTVPFGGSPVRLDVEEQSLLTQGFLDAVKEMGNGDNWLKGLFWYDFTSNPLLGGMGDINITPHGKPAETYLRSFYTNQPVTPLPTPAPQIEENQISSSYWLFDDQLEDGVTIGPWVGTGKQSIVADPLKQRGQVIAVRGIYDWEGLQLQFATNEDLRNWDYLELYLYAPTYEPNLQLRFDDLSTGQYANRWLFIRSFIDHEPLMDNHWHRIQIPLSLIFPADRKDISSVTSSIYFLHMWPGDSDPITFYMDGIRLIKITK